MKIAIIGYGYVGKAMTSFFEGHYNVVVYDPYISGVLKSSSAVYTKRKEEINQCDVAIVCVPTPRDDDGKCDISSVEEVISWLETPLIILKSTVEIGTTDSLRKAHNKSIVFSPEYCGESSYWTPYAFHTDVKETPFFIFGGEQKDTSSCVDLYMPIVGPTKKYAQTSAVAAETAKYMENVFYAAKIMFCYEMNEICNLVGSDYNEVRELWLLDPRINKMHTSVFSGNDRPFGGKCLPKDTSALVSVAKENGYDANFLAEILKSNDRIEKIRKSRKN
jgi:nucleotide sugar dehydrogenase